MFEVRDASHAFTSVSPRTELPPGPPKMTTKKLRLEPKTAKTSNVRQPPHFQIQPFAPSVADFAEKS